MSEEIKKLSTKAFALVTECRQTIYQLTNKLTFVSDGGYLYKPEITFENIGAFYHLINEKDNGDLQINVTYSVQRNGFRDTPQKFQVLTILTKENYKEYI